MSAERETLTYELFGTVSRELAEQGAGDGFEPDLILSIARGGLELVRDFCSGYVAEVRTAVIYEKPHSVVTCDYVWRRTDRWIDFPWSTLPPVRRRAGSPGH